MYVLSYAQISSASLIDEINAFKNEQQKYQKQFTQKLESVKNENKKLAEKINSFEDKVIHEQRISQSSDLNADTQIESISKSETINVYQETLSGRVYSDSDFDDLTAFKGNSVSSQVPLNLIKGRNRFDDHALVFGGFFEIDGVKAWGDSFNASTGDARSTQDYSSGIALNATVITFDVMSNINKWLQAYLTISSFDLSNPGIRNAFVTFGNLKESPFFFTIGKNRIPLMSGGGTSPYMAGLNAGYFRPLWRTNALFGYYDHGLNANFSYIQPESSNNDDPNFMASIFYNNKFGQSDIGYSLVLAYLYNIADMGMAVDKVARTDPVTGATSITTRQDDNSLFNTQGTLSYKEYSLLGGWITLLKDKSYTDNRRANSWYIQTIYSPVLWDRKTSFGLTYGQAYNVENFFFPLAGRSGFGLAVQGVEEQIMAYIQRPILSPQVLGAIEFGWFGLYDNQRTAHLTLDLNISF
ncbi:DUF3573 domain-containing protein [Francisellaceae bacterium]|nr:DUF3573 domain-containing protein [Francisellaceae bacterium]